ncbi:MAG TPA: hypothetical protein P5244_02490 [Syntrophales bacterium]|nr:hypothetical protein [Syntrophales bacterium]
MDKIILARLKVAKEAATCTKQRDAENYLTGYRDALDDVFMLLNGTLPSRKDCWKAINER